ncbi:hypothetical protein GCM10023219_31920 [Stakelama sediminis]|uniref:ABC-type glucose/galactose transport system permease subunit n=1 Tax=Stakelama sediminis TaxID=463200 RepID=A0A840Z1G4_9SPHN|nr:hypothetical protein [Stakelama sediminis]MBB5719617.1 ABC-type glucose/galactose transport system permease subunit [Stakelama sediminis]
MHPRLTRILLILIAVLAAALLWLWWSDAVFIHKCEAAGGIWNRSARVCEIGISPDDGASDTMV